MLAKRAKMRKNNQENETPGVTTELLLKQKCVYWTGLGTANAGRFKLGLADIKLCL